MDKKLISIITPIYNEAMGFSEYKRSISDVFFNNTEYDFDIILVDDGSSDGSWALIEECCRQDCRFKGLRLSRNFGAHVAISAGIDHATGDAVVILACDLQDPPETVLDFVRCWQDGAEIVWGARRSRNDGITREWMSHLFSRMIARHAMPRGSQFATGSFLLMDRKVADCFRRFRETNRITFALVAWTGFEQKVVHYDRRARQLGQSGWTFGRLFAAMYDTFIGFSVLPVRLITIVGVGVSALTIPFLVYLVAHRLFFGTELPGWTGIMFALTAFFGIVFLMLGVVAEYLHRIYLQTTQRPLYFLSRVSGDVARRAE